MRNFLKILIVFGFCISLSGCNSVRNSLGLDHYQPDEFNISDNPPLSMPKDYRLRPPMEGRLNPHGVNSNASTQQAERTLLGTQRSVSIERNSSQNMASFIDQARKGQEVDPQIRTKVDQEAKDNKDDGVFGKKLKEIKKNAASTYKKDAPSPGPSQS